APGRAAAPRAPDTPTYTLADALACYAGGQVGAGNQAGRCTVVDEHPSFAQLLRRYRAAAGLTQEELAEQAALSARAITDLERGVRRFPYPDTVERLARALHLSAEERQ